MKNRKTKNIQSLASEYRKTQIYNEFKEQVRMNVSFKIPRTYYEMWRGIVMKYGLDDRFLEFMVSRMMSHTLHSFMEMEAFAE